MLADVIGDTILSDHPDVMYCRLDPSVRFTSKSLYDRLAMGQGLDELRDIWKTMVPPKIKIFLWQLIRGRLPSGDQVRKCSGPANGICPLSDVDENLNHIFFYCVSTQFLWECFREVWENGWCPTNFPEFYQLLAGCSGSLQCL